MIAVLGAGISGISAAYHIGMKGQEAVVYEKDDDWGGLCGNFSIGGFRFDKAVHLSFTENEYVKKLFAESCNYNSHPPLAYNYSKGIWVKHPVQNNLAPLPTEEKIKIISDFIADKPDKEISNYEDWLKAQFGTYFSENYPMKYTGKYWTYEARELSTSWVGTRISRPDIETVLYGAFESETPNAYYASEMRYPKKGGYKEFFRKMAEKCNIKLSHDVININSHDKILTFADGTSSKYESLISSIPLPEYPKLIKDMPQNIREACGRLDCAGVALVSLGFNKPNIPKHLWFYVYDEDIPFARCYSPSMKSKDNAPDGCSSLQMEIYFSDKKPLNGGEALTKLCIDKLENMGICNKSDITVQDFRTVKYGNVIFYHCMENDRQIVLDNLNSLGIKTVGRFGKWDYLWSDQSLLSGMTV